MASNSFVENVNNLANATALATGDIVEDTQAARDEAVRAAAEALSSENNSLSSESLAQSWANKGYNNPVVGTAGVDAEFSAYHWSVEASNIIGDPLINDFVISAVKTWSSNKLYADLSLKSNESHLHTGVYEPVVVKQSSYNKAYAGTGVALSTSRSDHNHDTTYEPKRTIEGTSYNRDFGTTSGTVMEGDRNFNNDYMPLVSKGSAYNKNFVTDSLNPQSDEIPRGTHTHTASATSYDNAGNKIVSSGNVQGAISQLDSNLGQITISESTYISLLGSLQYSQLIASQNTPVKLMMPIPNIQSNKNATNNSNAEITVKYPDDQRPDKLIEGTFTCSLVFSTTETYEINIAINDVIAGESTTITGGGEVTISQFLTGLNVTGINGGAIEQRLSIYITNTSSATDVVIESANIVWSGRPEGALVFSGISVDHSDLTGTGAANGVHTISDTQGLQADLDTRPTLVTIPVLDNFVSQDATGNIKDSGVSTSAVATKMDKVTGAVLDRIIIMDSSGNSTLGSLRVEDLALKQGSAITFQVANSVVDTDAVNQGQMNAIANTYTTTVTFDAHEAATNPHNTVPTDIGAAEAIHTHVIADTTGLQDALDNKYAKVIAPIEFNIPSFTSANTFVDSGMSATSNLLTGEPV